MFHGLFCKIFLYCLNIYFLVQRSLKKKVSLSILTQNLKQFLKWRAMQIKQHVKVNPRHTFIKMPACTTNIILKNYILIDGVA